MAVFGVPPVLGYVLKTPILGDILFSTPVLAILTHLLQTPAIQGFEGMTVLVISGLGRIVGGTDLMHIMVHTPNIPLYGYCIVL